jgi:hypothetical protein
MTHFYNSIMAQETLLMDVYPAFILPQLACKLRERLKAYASDASAFLQQIHYWLSKGCGVADSTGRRWIYNTYSNWLVQFPWLTEHGFRKIKSALLGIGLIETAALNGCDRTLYYSVNYNHEYLAGFLVANSSTVPSVVLPTVPSVDCATDNSTDTSPEDTSNKTTTPPVVALSDESEYQEVIEPLPVRPEPPVKQVKIQPTAQDHSTIISDDKIKAVEQSGIPLNSTLCKAVMEYTLVEVQSAIAHYRQVVKEKGQRIRPGGWLTDCLRGQWWKNEVAKVSSTEKDLFTRWRESTPKYRYIHSYSDISVTGLEPGEIGVLVGDKWINWRDLENSDEQNRSTG